MATDDPLINMIWDILTVGHGPLPDDYDDTETVPSRDKEESTK